MFHVGASVGISLFPDDGKDAATLIRRADSAMYRAKDIGGDGYQFANPAVDTAMEGRLSLESDLRQALERDQFVVYYQPLVEIAAGKLAALEVLLRWERPDEDLVPPSAFVPLLEELGLIDEVGEWVLRTACEQNRKWQEKGLGPIPIAVNISAHQLRRGDLTDRVSRMLSETGLEPRFLQLEVTETAALKNMEHAVRTLHELRDLGVSTAVDDFGTGHSSLTRPQEFPVSALKIDKSFVKNVYRDGDGRAIVSGVIALGHALDMTVVAEGVETRAQLDALRALGCDVGQGFLFSRPVPAEACELMLREGCAMVDLQAA